MLDYSVYVWQNSGPELTYSPQAVYEECSFDLLSKISTLHNTISYTTVHYKNCTKILFGDNFTMCLENRSKLAKTF